jgi:formylmethanofuran dehydrogenase subunit C
MLRLTLRLDSPIPLEAGVITPDNLRGLALPQIRALPVLHGNRTLSLGEAFDVEGTPDGDIEIHGDCSRVKWLGHKMVTGVLRIHGNAGLHTGAEMTGGEIVVDGHAGDWLGAEMRNGLIRVRGNAGDNVGSAYRGGIKGMQGGCILIEGHAGHETGFSMRRGLIAIAGNAGDFLGASMIAGSIFVFGNVGTSCGAGMKRGTIFLANPASTLIPTFRHDCDYDPPFLRIALRHLQSLGFQVPKELQTAHVRRSSGDRLALGHGEILQPVMSGC